MKFNVSPLDVLSSKTKAKIVKFLLTHKASMSEREIASVLKVSHMSVNRIMRELADMNFVHYVAVGKAHLWRVNRKSYVFKVLSEVIKGSDIKSPLEELKKTILKHLPKTLIKKVTLFGSIAKESEKVDSDIDVFILVKDKQGKKKIDSSIDNLSNACVELYGNRLAPYVLTEREMRIKKNLKIISEVNRGVQIFPRKDKI